MRKLLAAAMFVLTAPQAEAGGTYWPVLVDEVVRVDESHAIITLRNKSKTNRDPLQQCEILRVKADYLPDRERPATWSNRITEQLHVHALALLEEHQKTGEPINFGYIGVGLVATEKNSPCDVVARGLANESGNIVLAYNETV